MPYKIKVVKAKVGRKKNKRERRKKTNGRQWKRT